MKNDSYATIAIQQPHVNLWQGQSHRVARVHQKGSERALSK